MLNLRVLKCAIGIGLFAISTSALSAAPPTGVRPLLNQKPGPGTCSVEISTVALTPAVAYDGSGGNILFSGNAANEHACDQQAISQWNNALNTGWSPANRCAIIAGTRPNDEILTEITYVWNSNPSVRSAGYGAMCHPSQNVPANPY